MRHFFLDDVPANMRGRSGKASFNNPFEMMPRKGQIVAGIANLVTGPAAAAAQQNNQNGSSQGQDNRAIETEEK